MSPRLKIEFVILAVMIGVLLGRIPSTLALLTNDYQPFDSFVDVQREIVRHYVEQPDTKELMRGAIQGMIDTLDDPHTTYLPPEDLEQFDKQTRGSFSGIGAVITQDPQSKQLTVVSPLPDSPAYKAGVKAGDAILEIDGKSTEGETTSQAVKRITGPEGTSVRIKVRHDDGKEEELEVVRRKIKIETVKGFRRDKAHHWDFMLDAANGIGYIHLTQFSSNTAQTMRQAIEHLQKRGLKGLILDLRNNPGGLLSQATEIADMFLSEGVIVSTQGRTSPREEARAKPQSIGDFPIVVLVNQFSASASEIVSGALKDNHRAIILGARTFGKGSVQQVRGLQGGSGAIKVTTAYYYLPSGRNIHRRPNADTWGVDPNDGYYLPLTSKQMEEMTKRRHDSEIINDQNGHGPSEISPEWIEKELADLQLAAALRTLRAKIRDGKFIPVGKSNATLQAHLSEKTTLERRREQYLEALDKLNQKLEELEKKIGEGEGKPSEAPAANIDAGAGAETEKKADKKSDAIPVDPVPQP